MTAGLSAHQPAEYLKTKSPDRYIRSKWDPALYINMPKFVVMSYCYCRQNLVIDLMDHPALPATAAVPSHLDPEGLPRGLAVDLVQQRGELPARAALVDAGHELGVGVLAEDVAHALLPPDGRVDLVGQVLLHVPGLDVGLRRGGVRDIPILGHL